MIVTMVHDKAVPRNISIAAAINEIKRGPNLILTGALPLLIMSATSKSGDTYVMPIRELAMRPAMTTASSELKPNAW